MSKIRVGVDVDGVLRDFDGELIKILKENGIDASHSTYWDDNASKIIDGKSLKSLIWTEEIYLQRVFEKSSVFKKAKRGYDMLCRDPEIDVYIVTDQRNGTEEYTYTWLEKNGFDKHNETYIEKNKLNAPCQILIDDKPANIEKYQNDHRIGLLMSRTHNQSFDYHLRVNDLIEAYKLIKDTI